MSESNLKAAVGQVLSAFPANGSGVRVQAELHHDALKTGKKGRKKSLDFALACLPDNGPCNNVEFAVETKWADSSHCKPNAIADDLIRLSLVKARNPQAVCILLLAGTAGSIQRKIKNYPFYEKDVRNNGIHVSSNERKCHLRDGVQNFAADAVGRPAPRLTISP